MTETADPYALPTSDKEIRYAWWVPWVCAGVCGLALLVMVLIYRSDGGSNWVALGLSGAAGGLLGLIVFAMALTPAWRERLQRLSWIGAIPFTVFGGVALVLRQQATTIAYSAGIACAAWLFAFLLCGAIWRTRLRRAEVPGSLEH